MRIALIAPPWLPVPPPAYGGTEAIIDRLARGFHAAGHDVLLFTTGDSTCPVTRGWVRERAAPERIGQSYVELHHLIHAYEQAKDCDVIHDHTVLGPVYGHERTTARIVTTAHGPFLDELKDIYAVAAAHATLITISQAQADSAGKVPVGAVIPHGLDPEDYPQGNRGDQFVFLGRCCPDKGVREAVIAAKQADVRLVLAMKVREPDEVDYFRDQVEPLLDDRVQHVGEVGHDQKIELLGSARALVNPIRWPEPFGLVMIEALACGTPVLALRAGSAPEIVDDGVTGFVCATVDELAARMSDVANLDRAKCRAAVSDRFSTHRMVDDHLRLYTRLLTATAARLPEIPNLSATDDRHRSRDTLAGASGMPTTARTSSQGASSHLLR